MFVEKSVKSLHPGGFHKIVYSEFAGNPEKTVVCVHGLSRNGRDFDWLAESLAAQDYRVICPDMPGRGRSPDFSNPAWYNYPQYVADMVTLLAQLNVESVDWVGTSMGGLIGMMVAAQQDHPIRRMVINDIGPFVPAAALSEIKQYVSLNPGYETWDNFMDAFRKRMATFGVETEEEWNYLARHSSTQDKDGKYRLNYDTRIIFGLETAGPITDVDLWPVWQMVDVPMLVLHGAESKLLSRETLDKMLIGKKASAITFPNVGHAPMLMNQQQISAVVDWLNVPYSAPQPKNKTQSSPGLKF